jgi:hypothetical protein
MADELLCISEELLCIFEELCVDELFIELCMPEPVGFGLAMLSASAVPVIAAARMRVKDKDVKRIDPVSSITSGKR